LLRGASLVPEPGSISLAIALAAFGFVIRRSRTV
jgi:hypothetical protein